MARRIKSLLTTVNKILLEQPTVWLEKEIPSSRIIHPQFQKHRIALMNSFTEDLHIVYHNPNKVKSFLQFMNTRLAVMHAFREKYNFRLITYPIIGLTIGWIFAYVITTVIFSFCMI